MTEPAVTAVPEPEGSEADKPATQEFKGESFRLAPELSEYALIEWYEAMDDDDGDPMRRTSALLRLAVALVHPDERGRFRSVCRRTEASFGDLAEFLGIKIGDDAERPTVRSSDSSDGPTSTEPKSASNSDAKASLASGPASLRGRPDLALIVVESRKAG